MRLLILCFGLLIGLNTQAQEAWTYYSSEAGNFVVLAPGEMEYRVSNLDLPIGELKYHIYFSQGKDSSENILYQVSYCDYPEGSVHSDSTEFLQLLFDQNTRESAKSVNGKVIYEEAISHKGYPGKLFKVHFAEDQAAIKTHLFMIENRYYALSVTSLRGKSLNPFVDSFLDSFRMIEGKPKG